MIYVEVKAEMAKKNLRLIDLVSDPRIDCSMPTLSQKLNGKYQITLKEAIAIKSILNSKLPLEGLFNDGTFENSITELSGSEEKSFYDSMIAKYILRINNLEKELSNKNNFSDTERYKLISRIEELEKINKENEKFILSLKTTLNQIKSLVKNI